MDSTGTSINYSEESLQIVDHLEMPLEIPASPKKPRKSVLRQFDPLYTSPAPVKLNKITEHNDANEECKMHTEPEGHSCNKLEDINQEEEHSAGFLPNSASKSPDEKIISQLYFNDINIELEESDSDNEAPIINFESELFTCEEPNQRCPPADTTHKQTKPEEILFYKANGLPFIPSEEAYAQAVGVTLPLGPEGLIIDIPSEKSFCCSTSNDSSNTGISSSVTHTDSIDNIGEGNNKPDTCVKQENADSPDDGIIENLVDVLKKKKELGNRFSAPTIIAPEYLTAEEAKAYTNLNIAPEALKKMVDLTEDLHISQQEISELKLQLNASQQARASLELEIRQKEEIIIKTQAESLKCEQGYKQEIKQLKEKLKENSKLIEKDSLKELKDQLEESKGREIKAIGELNQRNKDDDNYQKVMEEYENTLAIHVEEIQKVQEECDTTKQHLANLELAFSDVHSKYEKTKDMLIELKRNEEVLMESLQSLHQSNTAFEEKYESLKSHAKAQIDKSNRELVAIKAKEDAENAKLNARIKRLEIKVASLETALQQKNKECEELSALCDEVTGKKL